MKKFWTDKLDNLLRRYYPKGDLDELAQRIGTTRTAIKTRAQVLGIRRKVNVHKPWTERQLAYLRRHYADTPMDVLRQRTGHSEKSIYQHAADMGLTKSREYMAEMGRKAAQRQGFIDSQFKKGQEPKNKGKRQTDFMSAEAIERTKATRFQPGQQPHNTRPVGYESIDKDGYIHIKVADRPKMVLKHRYLWEQAHGPIPRGYNVMFRDGDRLNCQLQDLQLVSRAEAARQQVLSETPEQRAARAAKTREAIREQDRKDRLRLHWGLPTKHNRIKRW